MSFVYLWEINLILKQPKNGWRLIQILPYGNTKPISLQTNGPSINRTCHVAVITIKPVTISIIQVKSTHLSSDTGSRQCFNDYTSTIEYQYNSHTSGEQAGMPQSIRRFISLSRPEGKRHHSSYPAISLLCNHDPPSDFKCCRENKSIGFARNITSFYDLYFIRFLKEYDH